MSKSFKEALELIASEPKLHTSGLYILSKMEQRSLDIFKDVWPNISVERRRAIVQELLEIAEVNFEVDFDPVFLLGLGDEDAEVRTTAIKGLWENESQALIRPLIHLLKTDEAIIAREAAATALGKFIFLKELEEVDWDEASLAEEALLETIYHATEDIDVRRRAVEALGFSGDPRVTKIIETAYYDENDKMRASAIFAMGRNADPRWIPRVIEELDNHMAELRFEAARACGELEAKDAVSKLISLVEEDPDLEVQEMAIWSLGRIGGDLARLALESCLESDDETLAIAAQDSLDELNLFDDTLMLYDFEDGELINFLDDDFDSINGRNSDPDYLH